MMQFHHALKASQTDPNTSTISSTMRFYLAQVSIVVNFLASGNAAVATNSEEIQTSELTVPSDPHVDSFGEFGGNAERMLKGVNKIAGLITTKGLEEDRLEERTSR
ncbi:hypothetical protein F442_23198 [Phytophthora nicotianae P10297]|uniref:Uncharacterized protein n=1 Tax=Phytophthora nicotianae P10297 TaxID=1317064 RepID=W2XXT7_PHYNI|nr:hypothetical protein F442_23198 [Phytophthora nicotianae P10297]